MATRKTPRSSRQVRSQAHTAAHSTAQTERVREWVSIADPYEERTWMLDVEFLLSPWQCLYARGCQGVLTGPAADMAQGCCSYGAHFTCEEDAQRVRNAAANLDPSLWQFVAEGRSGGVIDVDGEGTSTTRLVDDACIFLNRPGFAGGAGCALHLAAIKSGVESMSLKPDVCWQLPLRRHDSDAENGAVTSTVTSWERKHWGDGGAEFYWWCTEAPEAFSATEPLYRSMRNELRAMIGGDVYVALERYLDTKAAELARHGAATPVALRSRGSARPADQQSI
ncbi:MAG: hypothetical protein ACP5P1_05145 [Acidimicrobiales bacterium]